MSEALGGILERLSTAGPVLLLIEDLHWADPSTLVALRSIARRFAHVPALLLGTMRPGQGTGELHRATDGLLRDGG